MKKFFKEKNIYNIKIFDLIIVLKNYMKNLEISLLYNENINDKYIGQKK